MKIIIDNVTNDSTELNVNLKLQDFKSAAAIAQLFSVLQPMVSLKQKLNVFSFLLLLGGLFGSKY
jgi:uncharacterized ion transporter superfamily protein YfcC